MDELEKKFIEETGIKFTDSYDNDVYADKYIEWLKSNLNYAIDLLDDCNLDYWEECEN